jgi:hypothetical protein
MFDSELIGELLEQAQADNPDVRREAVTGLLMFCMSELGTSLGIADDRLRRWVVMYLAEQVMTLEPGRPGRPDSGRIKFIAMEVELARLPVSDDDPPGMVRGLLRDPAREHVARVNHLTPNTVRKYHNRYGAYTRQLLKPK